MIPRPFLINDLWHSSSEISDVRNPATDEIIAQVCLGTAADMHAALEAALGAASTCAALPAYRRAEILHAVADGLRLRREEFVDDIVAQVGKPIRYARVEVDRAIITFTIAAEEATRINGDVLPLDIAPGTERHLGITKRFPIGVIAAIAPFNFPLNLVAHKIAPAFAAGNSVVLKPPPQAPLTSLKLGELFIAAGAPSGALNVVPCANAIAEQLMRDDRVAMVSFTGSAAVGWKLKSIAGKKKIVLELGGNAPVIVEDAQDLKRVATSIAQSAFAYAGQVCISSQRIFVHKKLFEEFCAAFVDAANACVVGDPRDAAVVVGPLIDAGAAQRIGNWISAATDRGAKMLCGGLPANNVMPPTVLINVPHDALLCSEEAFAPVALVESYDDFETALAHANASRYGLQAGVFTDSLAKVMRAFDVLKVGGVIANNVPSLRIDAMPYGGVSDSGAGREGLRYAIREMTDEKLLVLKI